MIERSTLPSPERNEGLVNTFTEFFEEQHSDAIATLENWSTDTPTLSIPFESVRDHNANMIDLIYNDPDNAIYNAEIAALEMADDDLEDVTVRFSEPFDSRSLAIRGIRDEDVGDLVSIEGIVSQHIEVKPKIEVGVFRCASCGTRNEKEQPAENLAKPRVCVNEDCNNTTTSNFHILYEESDTLNFQKVRVQEPPSRLEGGEDPQKIDVLLRGGITGKVKGGEKVTVSGVLRTTESNERAVLNTYIDSNNLEKEDKGTEDMDIMEEEENQIKELSARDDIYDILSESIAPSIKGHTTAKRAAAYQAFGGVRKRFADSSTTIRGDIHVLYVGDPGVGKSQILQYVKNVSTSGVYTSGKGSSAAGLTASAVRDAEFGGNDQWTLKAGAMVIADKGIACIDELDKMSDSDRSSMHEALEQQQVSISKAGINATLKSRCSLLAAANPVHGRFDEYEPVPEQIDLEPALISRFDLIFIIQDLPNVESDTEIADHILERNKQGQENARIVGHGDDLESQDGGETIAEISQDILKKYIAYAQRNIFPEMTDTAKSAIRDFYVDLRNNKDSGENDAIPITARKLEALVRLSEASARIRLSESVTGDDAKRAIKLMTDHLKQVGMDPETGEFDADMIESGTPQSQRDKIHSILDIIENITKRKEKDEDADRAVAMIDEITEQAEEIGMDGNEVEDRVNKLAREGKEIYSPGAADGYRRI